MAMYPCLSLPSLSFPTLTDSIVTFNSQYAGLPLKSHSVEVVATQSGSGTPSPSNPRPITGCSAIHIGNISDNTNISYFQGLLNGTYGFVDLGSLTWYMNTAGQFYTAQTNPTGEQDLTGSNLICSDKYTGGNAYTGDTDKTICIVGESLGRIWIKDSEYSDVTIFKNSLSGVYLIYELKTPTTPSFTNAEFEALCEAFGMNGQSISIPIGSTVYGGEYDARTGVFTVTDKIINLGNLSWSASGSNFVSPYFNLTDTNIKPPATNNDVLNGMCEVLNLTSYNSLSDKCIALSSGKNLFARNSDYIDATDFKNSVTGYYLKYPLATPTTIQLPPCPIDTLLGENNIWADTGDTTLQYPKFG